jgi:hypothetical protein
MTVKELKEALKDMPDDLDVLLAEDKSCGFPGDYISVLKAESCFIWKEDAPHDTPIQGWFDDDGKDKVLIYTFP